VKNLTLEIGQTGLGLVIYGKLPEYGPLKKVFDEIA
jgi:hypothetical protein